MTPSMAPPDRAALEGLLQGADDHALQRLINFLVDVAGRQDIPLFPQQPADKIRNVLDFGGCVEALEAIGFVQEGVTLRLPGKVGKHDIDQVLVWLSELKGKFSTDGRSTSVLPTVPEKVRCVFGLQGKATSDGQQLTVLLHEMEEKASGEEGPELQSFFENPGTSSPRCCQDILHAWRPLDGKEAWASAYAELLKKFLSCNAGERFSSLALEGCGSDTWVAIADAVKTLDDANLVLLQKTTVELLNVAEQPPWQQPPSVPPGGTNFPPPSVPAQSAYPRQGNIETLGTRDGILQLVAQLQQETQWSTVTVDYRLTSKSKKLKDLFPAEVKGIRAEHAGVLEKFCTYRTLEATNMALFTNVLESSTPLALASEFWCGCGCVCVSSLV